MLMDTVVIDLPAATGQGRPDHYVIRHKPSGRLLAWDDTLTVNAGEAIRYGSRVSAELRIDSNGEYEVAGLRYQPRPAE